MDKWGIPTRKQFMRHIIPISGKDSLATAIVQLDRQPQLPYELFFNDVGAELPETYEWLSRVHARLQLPVHRVGVSLEELIDRYAILPAPRVRFCTRDGKIKPMEQFIGEDEATVYFGIRADEDRVGYQSTGDSIIPCYPLKEEGIGLAGVYALVDRYGLRPPAFFWKRIHRLVEAHLQQKHEGGFGLLPSPEVVLGRLPSHVFDHLFAWRTRSNCYFCFFQRLYEWAGLLEHHPQLFDRAQEIEERIGNDQQECPYTWMNGYPLALVRRNAATIVRKRAAAVLKELESKRVSLVVQDALSVAGCGLFCGK